MFQHRRQYVASLSVLSVMPSEVSFISDVCARVSMPHYRRHKVASLTVVSVMSSRNIVF